MEDERQFRADYDLLSLDFRAPSQTSNHEGLYLAGKRFDALGFSNEIKLDHSFHLRNLDGISRQAWMACVAATAPCSH